MSEQRSPFRQASHVFFYAVDTLPFEERVQLLVLNWTRIASMTHLQPTNVAERTLSGIQDRSGRTV